jgi:hypothetical protein
MKITRRQISKLLEAVLDDDDIKSAISSEIESTGQITPEKAAAVVAQKAEEMDVDVPEDADTEAEIETALADNPDLVQKTAYSMAESNRKRIRKIINWEIKGITEDKDGKGKCPKSGCIEKDESGTWRIISNKTGKYWPQTYDSKGDAEDALQAYHASR